MRRNLPRPHSGLWVADQSSRRFALSARPGSRLTTGRGGTTASRLRFQESRNVPDLVSDGRSVDSPERATDIQSSFVLKHFHAAPADGGVDRKSTRLNSSHANISYA